MCNYFIRDDDWFFVSSDGKTHSLKEIVSARAVILHEDANCFKKGIKNSDEQTVTKEQLNLDIKVLNTLSKALLASRLN